MFVFRFSGFRSFPYLASVCQFPTPGEYPPAAAFARRRIARRGFVWKVMTFTQTGVRMMAKYILLMRYTDQGIHNVKETTKRAAAFATDVSGKYGVKLSEVLWTLGQYDLVLVAEAPNDEAMAACALSLAMRGNVKIQTLRAFRASEVDAITAKL
jgi:uncharacterized protein with GYD domain